MIIYVVFLHPASLRLSPTDGTRVRKKASDRSRGEIIFPRKRNACFAPVDKDANDDDGIRLLFFFQLESSCYYDHQVSWTAGWVGRHAIGVLGP
jgi:hypothetical protein